MTRPEPQPTASPDPEPADVGRPARLSLINPVPARAAEDRPESWGDRDERDADRDEWYRAQRPPHHGG